MQQAGKVNIAVRLREHAASMLPACDGISIAKELSCIVDAEISEIFNSTIDVEGLAIVAVGGYGRSEMLPYSDIDIMLLCRGDSPAFKQSAQKFLYGVWDRGHNISYSVRTMKGCVNDAMSDLHTRTAMMESRLVAGDAGLYAEYMRDKMPLILYKGTRSFVSSVLREVERRYKETEQSLYLLEPNVKESKGGLRDIHALNWLARSEFKIHNSADFARILTQDELSALLLARAFLLKMRAAIHVLSQRHNDQLTAELHEGVAELLGFGNTRRYFASEIMMRVFYLKSKKMADALAKVIAQCGRRYFQFPVSFGVKRLSDNFLLSRDEIIVKEPALLADVAVVMEAFKVYSESGRRFSMQAEDMLRARALRITGQERAARDAIQNFRSVLRGARVYETLKKMHDTGVLDRFIPEFGRIRHLIILEAFHRYTVDEHTLIAIRNVERLKNTKDASLKYMTDMLGKVKQEVLCAAILFHDIGKGISRNHEEAGYLMIGAILERLMFEQQDRQKIEFLVRNHIVLAKYALTRDIDSPETITGLAELVGTESNLAALYLMTYADMSAVNPSFWNEWKASLLRETYTRTLAHLQGIVHNPLIKLDSKVVEFAAGMPERYLIANTAEDIVRDHRLVSLMASDNVAVDILEKNASAVEITVATTGIARAFSTVVGALSARGFNIVRARLFAGSAGITISKIVISNWKALYWQGMKESVDQDLRKALAGKSINIAPKKGRADRSVTTRRQEMLFEIDNETNEATTIVEVTLNDRIGLLYKIMVSLSASGIDILSAMINTDEDIAQDIFYLQKDGTRLGLEESLVLLNALIDIGRNE